MDVAREWLKDCASGRTSRLWPACTRKESYEVAPHSENADLQLPCAAKKWRGVAPLAREPGSCVAWVRLQHRMHAWFERRVSFRWWLHIAGSPGYTTLC
jgi:hypothetical protein